MFQTYWIHEKGTERGREHSADRSLTNSAFGADKLLESTDSTIFALNNSFKMWDASTIGPSDLCVLLLRYLNSFTVRPFIPRKWRFLTALSTRNRSNAHRASQKVSRDECECDWHNCVHNVLFGVGNSWQMSTLWKSLYVGTICSSTMWACD